MQYLSTFGTIPCVTWVAKGNTASAECQYGPNKIQSKTEKTIPQRAPCSELLHEYTIHIIAPKRLNYRWYRQDARKRALHFIESTSAPANSQMLGSCWESRGTLMSDVAV